MRWKCVLPFVSEVHSGGVNRGPSRNNTLIQQVIYSERGRGHEMTNKGRPGRKGLMVVPGAGGGRCQHPLPLLSSLMARQLPAHVSTGFSSRSVLWVMFHVLTECIYHLVVLEGKYMWMEVSYQEDQKCFAVIEKICGRFGLSRVMKYTWSRRSFCMPKNKTFSHFQWFFLFEIVNAITDFTTQLAALSTMLHFSWLFSPLWPIWHPKLIWGHL